MFEEGIGYMLMFLLSKVFKECIWRTQCKNFKGCLMQITTYLYGQRIPYADNHMLMQIKDALCSEEHAYADRNMLM